MASIELMMVTSLSIEFPIRVRSSFMADFVSAIFHVRMTVLPWIVSKIRFFPNATV